jgi:hypothetical protein
LDLSFPLALPSSSSFVGHKAVVDYLQAYSQHHDLSSYIHTNTTVLDAVPTYSIQDEQVQYKY